jgi:hypothetical protein
MIPNSASGPGGIKRPAIEQDINDVNNITLSSGGELIAMAGR